MDLNKIKEKVQQYKESALSKSNIIWKAPAGKSIVRLVEYQHDKDIPFVELKFHFNIKKGRPILSPASYGDADPIVEFAQKLRKSGSKEDFTLARKLEPKVRVFAPVVVRGLEAEGIKIWGFSKTVAGELMNFIVDEDLGYGNIADPIKGRDIIVTTVTPQEAGNQYGNTKIVIKPNTSVLSDDASLVQRLLTTQPVIPDLYQRYTYDELKELLEEYLNPENKEAEQNEAETEQKSATVSQKSEKIKDLESAFDDIMNS